MRITEKIWDLLPDREFAIENIIANMDRILSGLVEKDERISFVFDIDIILYGQNMKAIGAVTHYKGEICDVNLSHICAENGRELATMPREDLDYIEKSLK